MISCVATRITGMVAEFGVEQKVVVVRGLFSRRGFGSDIGSVRCLLG